MKIFYRIIISQDKQDEVIKNGERSLQHFTLILNLL